MTKIAVHLTVNGEDADVLADASTTLLDVLRNALHLTGSKRGCSYGVCGACSVLIDGKVARSCLALAGNCEGRAITTIEGLGDDATAAALRDAFVEAGAVQCGYCTPAMIVALTDHFRSADAGAVTVETVRHALGGNICRCTGYSKIVEAAVQAAKAITTSDEERTST